MRNGNLFIIDLDKNKVDTYCFQAYFESEQGMKTLKGISAGSMLPNIGVSNLKNIRRTRMITDGKFYEGLTKVTSDGVEKYSPKLKQAIDEACEFTLSSIESKHYNPEMLLGYIQSGKTRGFIGLMALCFDNDFDMTIILTKCSTALVQQTVRRMTNEFKIFKRGNATVGEVVAQDILDIDFTSTSTMKEKEIAVASFLKKYRNKKRIIVVKKQSENVDRLKLFIKQLVCGTDYKRLLIIDDEADITSIGYEKNKEVDEFTLRRISGAINTAKKQMNSHIEYSVAQVTATPYALYLQPEMFGNDEIQPIKPVKTIIMPEGKGYIGGRYYFIESQDNTMPNYEKAKYLPHIVEQSEMNIINGSAKNSGRNPRIGDKRTLQIENFLRSNFKLPSLRKWLFDAIVGTAIIQLNKEYEEFYVSSVLHAATSKKLHKAEKEVIDDSLIVIRNALNNNIEDPDFRRYLKESYDDLIESVRAYNYLDVPDFDSVCKKVAYIDDGYLAGTITEIDVKGVNSDNDIMKLLNEDGELRLETSLTIFVGGQVLDRGITIPNMISFFYGRDPRKMQQDTVMQHCRMFGYRGPELLSVTRFYTTNRLFSNMREITIRDEILRDRIEKQKGDEVIYLEAGGNIKPCSPAKILASDVSCIMPEKRYLPVGFNVRTGKKEAMKVHDDIIDMIDKNKGFAPSERYSKNQPVDGMYVNIDPDDAMALINKAYSILEPEDDGTCNTIEDIEPAFWFSISEYLTKGQDKVALIVRRDRKLSKYKRGGLYQDAPEDGNNEGALAKALRQNMPVLVLVEQTNPEWKYPFWWPVYYTPDEMSMGIYAEKTAGKQIEENLYSVLPKPIIIGDFDLINSINIDESTCEFLSHGIDEIRKYYTSHFEIEGAPSCMEQREKITCPIFIDDYNEAATTEEVNKRLETIHQKAACVMKAAKIDQDASIIVDNYFKNAIEGTLTDEDKDITFELIDNLKVKKYIKDNLLNLVEEANNVLNRKDEPFGFFIPITQERFEIHIYLGTMEYFLDDLGKLNPDNLKAFVLSTIAHEMYHAIHFSDVTTESGRWLYTRRGATKQVRIQETLAEYFGLCVSRDIIDPMSNGCSEELIRGMISINDYPIDPYSGALVLETAGDSMIGKDNKSYSIVYKESLSDMYAADKSLSKNYAQISKVTR